MLKSARSSLLIALTVGVSAIAQTGSSSLTGTVVDTTNQVIPGCSVMLTNEVSGEQRTETTNALGDFVFAGVSPGIYTIRIEKTGFRPLERRGNVLISSTRLALGALQLQVGGVNESIEVTAEAAQVEPRAPINRNWSI